MQNTPSKTASNFVLSIENRTYWGKVISSALGYLIITLWLNAIRASASLWIVWPMIVIQFALYFNIFIVSYRRSIVLGLNKNIALFTFIILAFLGRVNDWEILLIPILIITMLVFSTRKKKLSDKGRAIFSTDKSS